MFSSERMPKRFKCVLSRFLSKHELLINIFFTLINRPFYGCVLSYLTINASEAGGDLALIQTSFLFSCKCHFELVSKRTT